MATIIGTAGDDSLTGSAAADVITGLAGDDTIAGGAGADTMAGGAGDDRYIVTDIDDFISEGHDDGIDTIVTSVLDALKTYSLGRFAYVENLRYDSTVAGSLKGNALDNEIRANAGNDTLWGAAGNDRLLGFGGNDYLQGGQGNDTLDGGTGSDTMVGGAGNDMFMIDSAGDRVFEYQTGGMDTIESVLFKDLRAGWTQHVEGLTYTGTAATALHGNRLSNVVVSRSATDDTLNGYDGNDTLDGGGGADSMVGGLGDDVYFVAPVDVVVERAGEGIDSMVGTRTTIASGTYATTIENLYYTGTTGASVVGNGLDNIVAGGSGADTVSGGIGNDSVAGGAGADSVSGGAGDDRLYGGTIGYVSGFGGFAADSHVDTLSGGDGNDRYMIDSLLDVISEATTGGTLDVVHSYVDNSLGRYANVEAMVLMDGYDAWQARGSTRADILVGNLSDNFISGGDGNDTIAGTSSIYNSYHGIASDILEGGLGDDVLLSAFWFGPGYYYGSQQETSMFGGAGNDLYVVGDNVAGYGGVDSAGTDTALIIGTTGTVEALEGVENVILYGSGAPEEARARDAIEAVHRAVSGQPYTGGYITAISAVGNAGGNTITGNALSNQLQGLGGNDTLLGGAGNDTLDGGTGSDSMVGGAGDDIYVLDGTDIVVEMPSEGFDIIQSATLTTYVAFANIEGLRYTGASSVSLGNGSGNTSNDYFGAGGGNDTLAGFGGLDTLYGGAGNDAIDGGIDNDALYGEDGNDTVLGNAGNDVLSGGNGNDSLDGGSDNDNLSGNSGVDTLTGGAGNDYMVGGDFVGGTELDGNRLSGGDGNDSLYGASGPDTLAGERGDDSLQGGAGNDQLAGGEGSDTLYGQAGDDTIDFGPGGIAGLWYQAATELGFGGTGLWSDDGSADADVFRLAAPTVANKAVESSPGSGQYYFNSGVMIADFAPGSDTIRLPRTIVGDGDVNLEGVVVKGTTGGTFDADAEMVIVRADVPVTFNYSYTLTYFLANSVIGTIGSADAAFAIGAKRIFVVDNGSSSALFQFTATDADATIDFEELSFLGVVYAETNLVQADFVLGA